MAKNNRRSNNAKGNKFSDSKNYKGKKFEKKGNPKDTNYEEDHYKTVDNDLTWYSKNMQLLFDSANINYPYPVGSKMSLSYVPSGSSAQSSALNYYLPGITQIGWRPAVGVSTDEASAVNIAARNVYSFMRQANSGAKNYDSNDLMLYLLAMDSCYAFHAFLIRIYGVLRNTAPTVRYLPEALTCACGGNYTDLTAHLADLRYYINFFGARLGAMAVPNNMYYFTRHRWMSANVYADEASSKPQLYVFVPQGFMQFGYDTDGAGELTYKALGVVPTATTTFPGLPQGLTFEELRAYGEALLAPIIGNEDFNIMSGDVLKAYSSNIVAIPTITEDYITGYAYSPEVLEQIHNLQCYNTTWNDETWKISQDATKRFLVFHPACDQAVTMPEVVIDSKSDIPTPGDTMILSRLISFLKVDPGAIEITTYLDSCGSEVVTAMFEYQFSADKSDGLEGKLSGRSYYTINQVTATINSQNGNATINAGFWNQLVNGLGTGSSDRAPLRTWIVNPNVLVPGSSGNTWSSVTAFRITGQKNNLTKVSRDAIDRMHQTALLSLFNVPALGLSK